MNIYFENLDRKYISVYWKLDKIGINKSKLRGNLFDYYK